MRINESGKDVQHLDNTVASDLKVSAEAWEALIPAKLWPHARRSKHSVQMSGGKGFGGGEATRDPAPTHVDPEAELWPQARRSKHSVQMSGSQGFDIADYGGVWGFDAKKAMFNQWDPEKPRSYTNFNPFERNDEGSMCDTNGCFPGQSRGYKPPNRPDQSWDIMQEERVKMDELKKDPKFQLTGKPGNFRLKWQDGLGAPP
jgi:hypothetical protein